MVVFNKSKKPAKQPPKKPAELALRSNKMELSPVEVKGSLVTSLAALAAAFSGKGELAPPTVVEAFQVLKSAEKLVADTLTIAKTKMQELVRAGGVPVEGTKGTIRNASLGYEIRPTRTGFDAKKVEAKFRAKQVDVNKYMDPVVVYVINDGKLLSAAADGVLTKEELESCRYDASFSVVQSKAGGEE